VVSGTLQIYIRDCVMRSSFMQAVHREVLMFVLH